MSPVSGRNWGRRRLYSSSLRYSVINCPPTYLVITMRVTTQAPDRTTPKLYILYVLILTLDGVPLYPWYASLDAFICTVVPDKCATLVNSMMLRISFAHPPQHVSQASSLPLSPFLPLSLLMLPVKVRNSTSPKKSYPAPSIFFKRYTTHCNSPSFSIGYLLSMARDFIHHAVSLDIILWLGPEF